MERVKARNKKREERIKH